MRGWRVFLRIAFRGARFEAFERDPASAREPFQRRFRGSNRAMVSLCSLGLFAEQDIPAGRADLSFMSARVYERPRL